MKLGETIVRRKLAVVNSDKKVLFYPLNPEQVFDPGERIALITIAEHIAEVAVCNGYNYPDCHACEEVGKCTIQQARCEMHRMRTSRSADTCEFDQDGVCQALICCSVAKCNAHDETGNPRYAR